METEKNPVKEYLFNYIKKSEKRFQKLFYQTKFDIIISDLIENCYNKVSLMDNEEESLGVLSTAILHYMLTNATLPSQRKIEYQGIEIDIIIPDLKTLKKDPKKTLIICIPKTINEKVIKEKLKQISKIQSEKQNIWFVLTKDINLNSKTYVIQKGKSSFSQIIYDIGNFVNVQGQNNLKILRV